MPSKIVETTSLNDGKFTLVETTEPSAGNLKHFKETIVRVLEMSAWGSIQTTVYATCKKSQRDKLVCAKVNLPSISQDLSLTTRSARSRHIAPRRFDQVSESRSELLILCTFAPANDMVSEDSIVCYGHP